MFSEDGFTLDHKPTITVRLRKLMRTHFHELNYKIWSRNVIMEQILRIFRAIRYIELRETEADTGCGLNDINAADKEFKNTDDIVPDPRLTLRIRQHSRLVKTFTFRLPFSPSSSIDPFSETIWLK